MKNISILFVVLLLTTNAMAQQEATSNSADLFAQGMLNLNSVQEMNVLQEELRLNPNLQVVRLDHNSNRFFLLTTNLTELNETSLLALFGEYANLITCIQIGVHGVDVVHPFPFTNCPN